MKVPLLCILFTYVITFSASFHGTFNCPPPFVELDDISLDVHGGIVAPQEFEGVSAGYFLVVLYLYPRLGEVGKNGQ